MNVKADLGFLKPSARVAIFSILTLLPLSGRAAPENLRAPLPATVIPLEIRTEVDRHARALFGKGLGEEPITSFLQVRFYNAIGGAEGSELSRKVRAIFAQMSWPMNLNFAELGLLIAQPNHPVFTAVAALDLKRADLRELGPDAPFVIDAIRTLRIDGRLNPEVERSPALTRVVEKIEEHINERVVTFDARRAVDDGPKRQRPTAEIVRECRRLLGDLPSDVKVRLLLDELNKQYYPERD